MSNWNNLPITDLLRLYIVRGMEGESKISEHWGDIVASRFKVRFYQWLGAMGGMAGILAGAICLGAPLAVSIGLGGFKELALVGCVIGIASLLASWAVGYFVGKSRSVTVTAVLSIGIVSIVTLALSLLTIAISDEMEWWRVIIALAGACIFTPSLAFAFNQLSDLVDPMGWISGFERMMRPYLIGILQSEVSKMVERPVFSWRHGNRQQNITARDTGETKDDEEGKMSVPDYLDLELADFLGEAIVRGLSRDAWIGAGAARFYLPVSGRKVNRSVYEQLIEKAVDKGYVTPGGQGRGHEWIVRAEEAYNDWCEVIEAEWEDFLKEE